MRSYLSLIPISAKVHRRQNRMTLLCIIFAVFLVTTIFSLIDMSLRADKIRVIHKQGNWHISLQNISENDAKQISSRSDVAVTSWYDVLNKDTEKDYYIKSNHVDKTSSAKKVVITGAQESYFTKIRNSSVEGSLPKNDNEIMLSSNAKSVLDVNIGDHVTITTPAGNIDYIISGFGSDDPAYYDIQTYLIGASINMDAFKQICNKNKNEDYDPSCYIQFKNHTNIRNIISDIKDQYGWTDKNISENTGLLGIYGFSSHSSMKNFYSIAGILFIIILIVGILMISSSINSNVAQKTQFFGMLRCIGMSKQQTIRFVKLEALNWCKIGIPAGIILGIFVTWILCMILRFDIGGEFADMPLFGVSAVGIGCGIIVGILTVLLSAQSPAKRAAKVSPAAAVSGNTETAANIRHAANTHFTKIETALGIHHTLSAKKNLFLMISSFTFSIILILVFSACFDFGTALIPSLRSWQPDLTILGYKNACTVDENLIPQIKNMTGVKTVFGNKYIGNIPVAADKNINHISLVSYDEYMLNCSKEHMISGNISKVYGDSNSVLTIYNKNNPLKVGDKIQVNGEELKVDGALSDGLFADDIIVICSEETFTRLMGKHDYAMINVQLTDTATDNDVNSIRALTDNDAIFSDSREINRESNATYYAARLLMYSFLMIIGLITILNIMNSISMSISAKIHQYGAMRAIGMDEKQLTKMITAEVLTYTLPGFIIGCSLGLFLNKTIFTRLVTAYFGTPWTLPVMELGILFLIMVITTIAAVSISTQRLKNMSITDTINEL